jgi:hypothetical protein
MKPLVVAIVLALLTVACGDNGSSESSTSSAVITRTHKFQEGETLYGLASEYLCDGQRWPELVELNELPLRGSGAVAPIPDGLLIKIPVEACATAPTSTLALEAQATTVAPTTTAAPAATVPTTQSPGPGSWPNQEWLDRFGVDHWADDLFIENVRTNTSPRFHNGLSDRELFNSARNICGSFYAYDQWGRGYGMDQIGPALLEAKEALTADAFDDFFLVTAASVIAYCDEFVDEFLDWSNG